MVTLRLPFDGAYPVTQTYAEHLANAVNYPPGRYNGAIDYGLPAGTSVLAAADGRISKIDNSPTGYGIYVVLDSPDDGLGVLQTLYAHLERVSVRLNDYVHAGDLIGVSGSTGNSTGPHLHFEVRDNGKVIDPAPLMAASKPTAYPAGVYETLGYLNIRHSPNLDAASIVGQLPPHWTYNVVSIVTAAGVIWGRADSGYYVALQRGSDVLCRSKS